ncbi:hypothetical protein J5N97_024855 [Dioscorea zingiberensis]|uniref:LysM domain-containing protein n=1 Tax=Dioscorea zingiberensis TaxID=325984 RepID=A0A9D5H9G1_9LILI|nr:hypothetical protein J5N97_024855 [Dioscorea zingiberensis]
MAMAAFLSIQVLLLLSHLFTASAANFTCSATATAKCTALIGFVSSNATTLAAIQSLFQIKSTVSLLGANSLPLSTTSSFPVAAGKPFRIPIPCSCVNGIGASDGIPKYTVKSGDILDDIATKKFERFVTIDEIAAANGIPNPNLIQPGQSLRIPLPCSCDPVDGAERVHLAHKVASGSSFDQIAADFGVNKSTLMAINRIDDPTTLQAAQILDVPLRACSSSISKDSMDFGLRLSNGSYAVTANGCVLCNCTSSFRLSCQVAQGPYANASSTCPAAKNCGNLNFGESTSSGCEQTTCEYAGYTNSTGTSSWSILTTSYNGSSSSCTNGEPTSSPSSHAHSFKMNFSKALIFIQMLLVFLAFC